MPQLKKILHVDDDHVMRMMTATALKRSVHEFTVESCLSGGEALEKIVDFAPDLMLVDMKMPIMDGEEFVRQVRALSSPDLAKVPVIFVTGKSDVELDNREQLEPILGIIGKPFSAATLGDDLLALWANYTE